METQLFLHNDSGCENPNKKGIVDLKTLKIICEQKRVSEKEKAKL